MAEGPSLQDFKYQLAHIHDDRRRQVVALNATLLVLGSITVVLRLIGRKLQGAQLKIDDFLMVLAVTFACAVCVVGFLSAHYGLGLHVLAVGLKSTRKYLIMLWVYQLMYLFCLTLIKFSILLFYRRIFPTPRFKIAVNIVFGFVLAWFITVLFLVIFQCLPIHHFWDRLEPGFCIDSTRAFIATAGLNIATDTAILALPIPTVWNLRIPRPRKIALTGVFLVGGFVCIASIVRACYLSNVISSDPTWTAVDGGIWSTIEPLIGLMTANLPMMRPIYRKVIKSQIDSMRSAIKTPKFLSGLSYSLPSKSWSAVKRSGDNSHISGGGGSRLSGAPWTRPEEDISLHTRGTAATTRTTPGIQPAWPGFIPCSDEPWVINTVGVGTHAHASTGRIAGDHPATRDPEIAYIPPPLGGGISVSREMYWSEARRSRIL